MLVSPSVVRADANAYSLKCRIEALFGERFPCASKRISPFLIALTERQLVLDLEM
jgi:hypothetical protein